MTRSQTDSTPETSSARKANVLRTCGQSLMVLGLGFGLTYLFWSTIWHGGGWIGGDIYTYYFPQKLTYQESLTRGDWVLWNDLVAHGYPQLAESQTGVFYPLHLLFYTQFDLCRAYHLNQLMHYVLAFAGTVLLARTLKLSLPAAVLAGVVYTYSWFPARTSLEWAIVGGAWLPFAVWTTERFLVSRAWKFLILLAAILAMQLLAGHFVIAFLTILTTLGYAFAQTIIGHDKQETATQDSSRPLSVRPKFRILAACGVAIVCGFLLAGVQLVPTWELKQHSQRDEEFHDVGYGHLPPEYLAQVVAPWKWYSLGDSRNEELQKLDWLSLDSATNTVEAHLYFGLVPFGLAIIGLFPISNSRPLDRWQRFVWWGLALLAVSYAVGWWLPLTRYLPGFSFFIGPGRYGLITTLAIAILSAEVADSLFQRWKPTLKSLAWSVTIGITVWDLFLVSRLVSDATIQTQPAFDLREFSPVREYLSARPEPVRLHAPGQNLPTLLGVSAIPQYLGLSPTEYFQESTRIPPAPDTRDENGLIQHDLDFSEKLRQAGVTHLLTQQPVASGWPCQLVLKEPDPFLNAAWGRRSIEPIYLYELNNPRGRVFWNPASQSASDAVEQETTIEWIEREPERHELKLVVPDHGQLVVTELLFPGWKVDVDGEPATPLRVEGMFRGVELSPGEHTVVWKYRPASFGRGIGLSLGMLCLLAVIAHVRFWHPGRLNWLENR